jgi:O-antigen ligase
MPIIALIFAAVGLTWGAIVAKRVSLMVGCGLVIAISYVVGHEFWNVHFGPLPVTLGRLLLAALVGVLAFQWRRGDFKIRSMTGCDWLLAALLIVLTLSAVLSGQPDITDGVTSKWGRLFASVLLPIVLYAAVRQFTITRRNWSHLLAVLVAMGIYLACTAIFETGHLWAFVFPRYIADPTLGIHFGRARGPELNSVSLGLYLTACGLCAWMLLPEVRRRWQQLVLLIAVPLLGFGVLLTYTRSTWIGMIASAIVVAAFQIPRRWRYPAFTAGAVVGVLLVACSWSNLLDIKREGSTGDSEHSVDQRESFAYVSWHMFCDHPIWGVGFGRFFDQKLPYLSDRRQVVELESIRNLHHHNTLLSVLVETGIVGFAAFVAVLVAWGRAAWSLAANIELPAWIRTQGVLTLALLANYLSSAIFHDLTLLPSQELLLFLFAAVTINVRQATCSVSKTVISPRPAFGMLAVQVGD